MRLIPFMVLAFIMLAVLGFVYFSPAHAAEAVAAAASAAPSVGLHIDFTPLIPVINGLIVAIAGVLTASTPVMAYYIVMWLRNHGIAVAQTGQKAIADRISATIQNGLKYATSGADSGISKLSVSVENETIAKAANYAILQSPKLLKAAGIDVTTEEGQQALIRRVTAESMPTPPALAPTTTTNLTSEAPQQVGSTEPNRGT